jgi:hypothetical protein
MATGLKARGDDGIHARFLKHCSLIGCCRRANRDDAFRPALLQSLPWRNSTDKAEYRYVRVQQHASLIFKSSRRIGLIRQPRRCPRAFVFHRHPQVHCERLRGKRANLCYDVFDGFRRQPVCTE